MLLRFNHAVSFPQPIPAPDSQSESRILRISVAPWSTVPTSWCPEGMCNMLTMIERASGFNLFRWHCSVCCACLEWAELCFELGNTAAQGHLKAAGPPKMTITFLVDIFLPLVLSGNKRFNLALIYSSKSLSHPKDVDKQIFLKIILSLHSFVQGWSTELMLCMLNFLRI